MFGAIIGDVIGSAYEHTNLKGYDYPLVTALSQFTDDTVIICATADAIQNNKPFAQTYRDWFNRYRDRGYGPTFEMWALDATASPTDSIGNGAAIRGVAIGALAEDIPSCFKLAIDAAECSHDTQEANDYCGAIAYATYLARTGEGSSNIKHLLHDTLGIDLKELPSFEELHNTYEFDATCKGSVPIALKIALETKDFLDCMRTGLYVGGDTDTILAMAGGISQYLHGIPDNLSNEIARLVPDKVLNVVF